MESGEKKYDLPIFIRLPSFFDASDDTDVNRMVRMYRYESMTEAMLLQGMKVVHRQPVRAQFAGE